MEGATVRMNVDVEEMQAKLDKMKQSLTPEALAFYEKWRATPDNNWRSQATEAEQRYEAIAAKIYEKWSEASKPAFESIAFDMGVDMGLWHVADRKPIDTTVALESEEFLWRVQDTGQ